MQGGCRRMAPKMCDQNPTRAIPRWKPIQYSDYCSLWIISRNEHGNTCIVVVMDYLIKCAEKYAAPSQAALIGAEVLVKIGCVGSEIE